MVADRKSLTKEQANAYSQTLIEAGYIKHEYVMPERIVKTTLSCPICGNTTMLRLLGDSSSSWCVTEGCFRKDYRGI